MRRYALIPLLLAVAAPAARGDEAGASLTNFTVSPSPIIQNRSHKLVNELSFGPSLLPSDAYTKQAGFSVGLTHHFSDLVAWEIFHAHGYIDWRSGLRAQLEDNFGVPPQRFPVLRAAVDSNFVVSPVYAKLSLLNGKLLYLQLFALVGAGVGLVQGGEPDPESGLPGRGLHAAVLADVGIGVRAWLSRRWSLRYDLRQYVAIDTATREVTPPLYMSLTFAVSLGGGK
jgi:outer membrane beta-barrel protein